MANPEREIKYMDGLMSKLHETAITLEGVILQDHIYAITSVIAEWEESTKGCIEELAQELNQD